MPLVIMANIYRIIVYVSHIVFAMYDYIMYDFCNHIVISKMSCIVSQICHMCHVIQVSNSVYHVTYITSFSIIFAQTAEDS